MILSFRLKFKSQGRRYNSLYSLQYTSLAGYVVCRRRWQHDRLW